MTDLVLPFLLTWLVHGTLLLAGTWVATRLWRRMPLTLQEALWRAALVGGFITAGVQFALDWQPVGGRVTVLPAPEQATAVVVLPVGVETALRPIARPAGW